MLEPRLLVKIWLEQHWEKLKNWGTMLYGIDKQNRQPWNNVRLLHGLYSVMFVCWVNSLYSSLQGW